VRSRSRPDRSNPAPVLEGLEGADVKVKCDKDVKVLKVTVTSKK
jgi:hypothetical protein